MKSALLTLIAASFCLAPVVYAKDIVLLPAQQNNNCANLKANQRQVQVPVATDKTNLGKKVDANKITAPHGDRPIDLIICLDTSNSMDGLIGSAKDKIWDIVNELAVAKPKPHLRVGLYAYGSPSFGAASGYVHKVLDLSDDLDTVFTQLTAISTNGGEEYCARVISTATNDQPWSKDKNALKIIVIAGNEPATQDPKLNISEVAKAAIAKNVIVNAIYCGSPSSSEANGWREIAHTAEGQFAAIDQDRGTVVVSTPYDQKLAELSGSINRTYVAYGSQGQVGLQNQSMADSLSLRRGASNYAARVVAKSSGQYRNSSWDLVDAYTSNGPAQLSKIQKEELPTEMQSMNSSQQQAYISTKAKERADIQKQITDLSMQRSKFIQEQLKKTGTKTDKAFDTAMLKALREQAERKGFAFNK